MSKIPDSYREGAQQFESLNDPTVVRACVYAMLNEMVHIFPGGHDDYPVQVIVNVYPYLKSESQKLMSDALVGLIENWIEDPFNGRWGESSTRALLSLIAELRVMKAKRILKKFVESRFLSCGIMQPATLRAIATLSSKRDRPFWNNVKTKHPEFNTMANQALGHIVKK